MDATRHSLIRPPAQRLAPGLAAGLVYCVLASGTLWVTESQDAIAAIWPANAALLAFLMLMPRTQWPGLALGAFIGNAVANLLVRDALGAPLLFGIANIVEVLIAAFAFRLGMQRFKQIDDPGLVVNFLIWAGIIAPGAGALIGAFVAVELFGGQFHVAFLRWYTSDALSLLIFVPVFVAMARGDYLQFLRGQSWPKRVEIALLHLFNAALCITVFYVARYPAVFLLIVPLMLLIFRAGAIDAKLALMVLTLVATGATISDLGPVARIPVDPNVRIYMLQFMLAIFMLVEIPVSAALRARDALFTRVRESEQSLRMFAAQSPILLLSFDLDGICQRVIGTTDLLLERDPATLVGGGFAKVSEEGQLDLKRAHNDALDFIDSSHAAEFRTIKQGDRWIEAQFRANFDADGRCTGTVATLHDVSERKQQELTLSRSARTDSLTGLLNRAGFNQRLDQVLQRASAGSVSLALIDVDRFKQINDDNGHIVGDLVLKEIARRISREVRSSDAVGRLGGDEFVILLPTSDWDIIQEICRRVVETVNADPITLPSGVTLRTAISCGVARLREGLTADAFINAADQALYEAKRSGRNRLVAA